MDTIDRLLIERACEALSIAFARCLDFNDQDHFLELFTEDATLDLEADAPREGLAAIAEYVGTRPRHLRTRHLLTNHWVDAISADEARGIAYVSLYAVNAEGAAPQQSVAMAGATGGLLAVGHFQDRYRRTADGWRIASRKLHWAMHRPED